MTAYRQIAMVRANDVLRDTEAQPGTGNLVLHAGAAVQPLKDAALFQEWNAS
jgi:hypothetical protein